jgi:hypothetical protein
LINSNESSSLLNGDNSRYSMDGFGGTFSISVIADVYEKKN